jgi:hypothetical protein
MIVVVAAAAAAAEQKTICFALNLALRRFSTYWTRPDVMTGMSPAGEAVVLMNSVQIAIAVGNSQNRTIPVVQLMHFQRPSMIEL